MLDQVFLLLEQLLYMPLTQYTGSASIGKPFPPWSIDSTRKTPKILSATYIAASLSQQFYLLGEQRYCCTYILLHYHHHKRKLQEQINEKNSLLGPPLSIAPSFGTKFTYPKLQLHYAHLCFTLMDLVGSNFFLWNSLKASCTTWFLLTSRVILRIEIPFFKTFIIFFKSLSFLNQ